MTVVTQSNYVTTYRKTKTWTDTIVKPEQAIYWTNFVT
jgi:hypothetical protein